MSIEVKFDSIAVANIYYFASSSYMANSLGNLSRRTAAMLWLVLAAIVIGVFIYFEQIAILYVLATLGIVSLLLIVAFADLENVGKDVTKNT